MMKDEGLRAILTHTVEDYLKAIFELTASGKRASTNQLAEYLDVSPASVTEMIKKLSKTAPPLVEYQRHHGVFLTTSGEKIALETLRHHRLLEMFLHQMLGYKWDEVHAEADRLEHVISEEFEERIDRAMGNPQVDPHGHPIPNRDLRINETFAIPLVDLNPGEHGTILSVNDTDPALLRFLAKKGVIPRVTIQVLGFSPFDGNMSLQVMGQAETLIFGPRITHAIFVEPTSRNSLVDKPQP